MTTFGSVSGTSGTTKTKHDPLCGYRPDVAVDYGEWVRGAPCRCDLIEKVRTDERSRWKTPYFSEEYHRGYRQGQQDERETVEKKASSVAYAQGFLDALEETSWTCLDCGNTYDPSITECPNRYLDEAKVALRAAQYRAEETA